jgi:GNAT superfamily N-acetyltransferase
MRAMTIIRNARPGDAAGIAGVHVASWQSTYAGLLPAAFLVGMTERAVCVHWRATLMAGEGAGAGTVVAALDADPGHGAGNEQTVVGFASYGKARAALDGFQGEFYALYLQDVAQGRGTGRRLMGAMAERMLAIDVRSAVVWCLAQNPSRWFYERLGGVRVAERPGRFAGTSIAEVGYGWRDLAPLARMAADPPVG